MATHSALRSPSTAKGLLFAPLRVKSLMESTVLVSGSACRGRLFYVIGNSVGIAYYIKSLTEQERTAAEG